MKNIDECIAELNKLQLMLSQAKERIRTFRARKGDDRMIKTLNNNIQTLKWVLRVK